MRHDPEERRALHDGILQKEGHRQEKNIQERRTSRHASLMKKGDCPNDNACEYWHPPEYSFNQKGSCKLGSECAFKHTEKAGGEPKKLQSPKHWISPNQQRKFHRETFCMSATQTSGCSAWWHAHWSATSPGHAAASAMARLTDRPRLRRLKSTLLSTGAWQQVTRIEDLCHMQVSHKGLYHLSVRMCGKYPDAARPHHQRAEKTWKQTMDRIRRVPTVRLLFGPTVGTCRDVQHRRSFAETLRVRSHCGLWSKTRGPRHHHRAQRAHSIEIQAA